jgi:hypothetical protein
VGVAWAVARLGGVGGDQQRGETLKHKDREYIIILYSVNITGASTRFRRTLCMLYIGQNMVAEALVAFHPYLNVLPEIQ